MEKIITKQQWAEIKKDLPEGTKIGLCHGVFDLVHPGHIIHFEEAKKICDILVVSITAAKYVRKGPDRPYFNDDLRLKFLSEIACVDYCMLSDGYTVDDIVECVQPDYYIKGQEYASAKDDVTGMINHETELVRKYGGQIYYTSGQVFSSTKLINKGLGALKPEVVDFMSGFTAKYSLDMLRSFTEKVRRLRVLVIGDIIIDKYTYCSVQGLMSKDTAYSARFVREEEQLGGSLAIARHLKDFTKNITLCSVMGNEKHYKDLLLNELGEVMRLELIESAMMPTIVKSRFLQKNAKRDEYKKLFVINNIPEKIEPDDAAFSAFYNKIEEIIDNYDLVILSDFGHGLINEEVMELVQDKAKFLALNCQTNSSNYGMNLITKYKRADIFALDQKELKLAFPFYQMDEKDRLRKLSNHFIGGAKGFLTRGSEGAYGYDGKRIIDCPAFTLNVVDTIGAGDAFFSLASLYAAAGASMELALFIGNIAGALAANIVGNQSGIEKSNLLKFASTLLNV